MQVVSAIANAIQNPHIFLTKGARIDNIWYLPLSHCDCLAEISIFLYTYATINFQICVSDLNSLVPKNIVKY